MELGLSLGDTPSKTFDGVSEKVRQMLAKTAAAVPTLPSTASGCSLGLHMDLATNPSYGTNDQHQEKRCYDGTNEDEDDYYTSEDQRTFKDVPRINPIIDGRHQASQSNPPVQLDLLRLTPILRHAPLLWSSDHGVCDPAGRGFDVNSVVVAQAGLEEATSSLQLDLGSYGGTGNSIHKMELEVRNEAVEMERASSRASDEDENGFYKKNLRLSKQQSAYLEESFKDHSNLNPKQKLELSKKLNLSPRQVEVWFQNRRARMKLKQTEVECEYLKKCCETLRGENRRLQKEVQELRALKITSNPFCLQLPATTLTMCPACERVAATTFTTTTSAFRSAPPPPSAPNTNLRESISTTTSMSSPLSSKR